MVRSVSSSGRCSEVRYSEYGSALEWTSLSLSLSPSDDKLVMRVEGCDACLSSLAGTCLDSVGLEFGHPTRMSRCIWAAVDSSQGQTGCQGSSGSPMWAIVCRGPSHCRGSPLVTSQHGGVLEQLASFLFYGLFCDLLLVSVMMLSVKMVDLWHCLTKQDVIL